MNKISTFIKSTNTEICVNIYENKELSPKAHIILLSGDGVKGLKSSSWPPLIEKLTENNYTVIGFDFISQGDSKGLRENLNLSSGIENLNDTINFVTLKYTTDKIFFVASSFGGAVLLANKKALEKADAIIFKSPVSDLIGTYENELLLKNIIDWKKNKINPETGIAFDSYLDALKYNLYSNVSSIKCPVLIIQGAEDKIVPLEHSERLNFLIGNNSKLIVLKGVKHNYKQNNALVSFVENTVNQFNLLTDGKKIKKNI